MKSSVSGFSEDIHPLLAHGWLAERPAGTQAALLAISKLRTYKAGQYVYRVGERGTGIFGLIDGALDLIIPVEGRPDLVAHRADPGYWIGDLAVISGRPRLVSVRACRKTTMLVLPAHPLLRLLRKSPDLHHDFYELTNDNMELALRFLSEALAFTGVERIARRLAKLEATRPKGVIPDDGWLELSQATLAGMVGVSLPTVQRALRRLGSQGLIATGYGKIRVLDVPGLATFEEFP